jgi:hypothetical protein
LQNFVSCIREQNSPLQKTADYAFANPPHVLITTEAMVAELPKKNAGAGGGGMPPGGGMGGMDF